MSGDYIDDVFGPTGVLSKRGYTLRAGQIEMARTIDRAIRDSGHAIIEAPTGTGKSLAYAVPTIYHIKQGSPRQRAPSPPVPEDKHFVKFADVVENRAASYPQKAILVTANIALQEQLIKKDLPLLREVLPWKFSFALRKGMGNYLCSNKYAEIKDNYVSKKKKFLEYSKKISKSGDTLSSASALFDDLCAWAGRTSTGDRSELTFDPPKRLWAGFSSSKDQCLGEDCEYYPYKEGRIGGCFPKLAAATANEADVIVTNYHLFFVDLLVRQRGFGKHSVLPPHTITIFDEGHKAVDIARDFFGWRITPRGIEDAGSELEGKEQARIAELSSRFFSDLADYRRSAYRRNLQRRRRSRVFLSETAPVPSEFKARIEQQNPFNAAELVLALRTAYLDEHRDHEILAKQRRCRNIADCIEQATILIDPLRPPWVLHPTFKQGDTAYTRWFLSAPELGGNGAIKSEAQLRVAMTSNNVYFVSLNKPAESEDDDDSVIIDDASSDAEKIGLSMLPISVAEILRDMIFRMTPSVVVTSATLVAKGSFDYVRDRLGIVEESKPEIRTLVAESPFDWSRQALLVLPTDLPEDPNDSMFLPAMIAKLKETLELAHGRTLALFTSRKNMNAAYEDLKKGPWRIFRQGDKPRTKLIEEFRKDIHSVLLGVESFWAGVDVQGESLSCVFIDKLPFIPPDDPILDAIPNGFEEYSIPHAIIALKQGFGRLIRTTTDKGVVVLCDRRVTTRYYGPDFLNALPLVRHSFDLQDVHRFLEGEPLRGFAGEVCSKNFQVDFRTACLIAIRPDATPPCPWDDQANVQPTWEYLQEARVGGS